jgi:EmrB/QacA subfamily drug resistance transporter
MSRRWKVLITVSAAVFMASLDLFIVNIALPGIGRAFPASGLGSTSWVLNGYSIVYAACLVPAGRYADRVGRRRVFLLGLLVFVVGSALCGSAPSIVGLVLARIVQATGAACLTPTSLAVLLPEFEPSQRPTAIGVWAAVGGIAAALGPPLGGLLVEANWRLVFWVNVPIGVVTAIVARRLLRDSRDPDHSRPDLLAAAILTVAIGSLALSLVKAPDWGWDSVWTIGWLAAATLGLVVFWWRCYVHPAPVIDPTMLRVRSFAAANTASLLFSAGFSAMLLGNVLFMTGVWHYSALKAGLSLTPGPTMAAIVAAPAGAAARRFSARALSTIGLALFTIGSGSWLTLARQTPNYPGQMLPGLIIGGIGVGLVLPSLAGAASAALPTARYGTGSAIYTMARQIGFVIGVAALIAVLRTSHTADSLPPFDRGWLLVTITATLGMLAAWSIGRSQPPPAVRPWEDARRRQDAAAPR